MALVMKIVGISNKKNGMNYSIADGSREPDGSLRTMQVNKYQIVSAVLGGNNICNVRLNKKGFGIKQDDNRVKYVQVDFDPNTRVLVNNYIAQRKAAEEAVREESRRRKAEEEKKQRINVHVEINGNKGQSTAIHYHGDYYSSPERLCKKFNADPHKFIELYNKGYSIDETLGLKKLRPIEEVRKTAARRAKLLDSMSASRGEC